LERESTAIVAERFKLHAREQETLAGGFDVSGLNELVQKYPVDNLMIVGHEPNFTEVICGLTGADCKLSKGGVALIELEKNEMKGRLLWLFPPKIAKLL